MIFWTIVFDVCSSKHTRHRSDVMPAEQEANLDTLVYAMDTGNISRSQVHEEREKAVHAIGSDVKIMARVRRSCHKMWCYDNTLQRHDDL